MKLEMETIVCRRDLEAGYPADNILYFRGGMHDWITLDLPVKRL